MNTSITPFTKFRAHLRRRAPMVLCAAAGVLLLLSLLLGSVYLAFEDIALRSIYLRDNEFSAQTDALSHIMEDLIRNYGMQAFYASEVTELRENGNIDDLQRVRDLRELGTYVSSSDFVDSILVYNRASDTVYTTDSDTLSDAAPCFADKTAVELFLSLNIDLRMTPIKRTAFEGEVGREKEYFSFLFFETNSEDEPRGNAMMLNVDCDWFVGNLLSFDDRNSCVLMDRHGKLIYSPKEGLTQLALSFQKEAAKSKADWVDYLVGRYDGVPMVCHFSKIDAIGWTALRILPLSECLPGLLQLRNALSACLGIAFILLVTIGTATLIFLYVPFQKIRIALKHLGSTSAVPEIQIDSLVKDSLKYQQSHLLVDLLEGRSIPQNRIPNLPLTLLLIECPQPIVARGILTEDCPEVLLRHDHGFEMALIPGLSELEVMEICGVLSAHAECRCYCSVPRTDITLIPQSYATLQEIQNLRYWYPGQQILSEKHFSLRTEQSSLSEKQLSALISALKGGELEEGHAIWHNILQSIRRDSYRDQRFAFYRVAQLLQETLASQGQKVEPILNDTFLNELEDITFLTAEFDKFFSLICSHSVEHRRHRLSDIALQVSHRIDVGYENPDLSPLRIADEMGMSSAYLSRLFKESLGQSIGEYMNNVRIKNASKLLLTTELSVESIAYKVGFGNPKYFFVVFKNVTGSTPLQFRQRHSEEKSED